MKFFCVLLFASAVFATVLSRVSAGGVDLKDSLVSCNHDDLNCLKLSTDNFLSHTHKGVSQWNVQPIDPMLMAVPNKKLGEESSVYENENVTVKGLKNQKLVDYKMDLSAKSVSLTMAADLAIERDFTAVLKSGKRAPGHAVSRGSALITATYHYELQKDTGGVQHFVLGPASIFCKLVRPSTVQYNAEYERAVSKDADALDQSYADSHFCGVAELAFQSVLNNISEAAKLLPASAFFKDVN